MVAVLAAGVSMDSFRGESYRGTPGKAEGCRRCREGVALNLTITRLNRNVSIHVLAKKNMLKLRIIQWATERNAAIEE